jgi:DNA-directed RNA polymerase specialized sigma24 family protein
MRRLLVDRARRVEGPEAGGDRHRVEFTSDVAETGPGEPDWEAIDNAMSRLASEDPELAEIVHLRYYAGLSVDEVAAAIEASPRTVDRRWQVARAWILDYLARHDVDPLS